MINHHTRYDPEKVVQLCASCHAVVHNDPSHELHPVDDIPDNFDRGYGGITIPIDSDVRDRLRAQKIGNETYTDVIKRLLETSTDA